MGHKTTLLVLLIAATASALAQSSGGDFELIKSTIDSGGGTASGAGFELVGTIAQPEAGPQASTGGDFRLAGGFWANAGANAGEGIFSDSFEGN